MPRAANTEGVLIDDAIYTAKGVNRAIGIGEETLREWRRRKLLTGYQQGGERGPIGYLGADVRRAWMETAKKV